MTPPQDVAGIADFPGGRAAYMRPVDVPVTTHKKQHHPRSLNSLRGWFFYHTNYFTKLNGRSLWNATVQCSLAEAYKPSTSSNVRVASAGRVGTSAPAASLS